MIMSFRKDISDRVGKYVLGKKDITSKKMFGGVGYLVRGNMFCGVYKNLLILRLGEKGAEEALRSDHVLPFNITGRPMKGWVMVHEEGFRTDGELTVWLEDAQDFVRTLPAKDHVSNDRTALFHPTGPIPSAL